MTSPKPSQAPDKKPMKVGPPTVDVVPPDKSIWSGMSAHKRRAYIAHLRKTADDVDAGVGATAASWASAPKSVQRAFAQALRREADKLDHETPTKK